MVFSGLNCYPQAFRQHYLFVLKIDCTFCFKLKLPSAWKLPESVLVYQLGDITVGFILGGTSDVLKDQRKPGKQKRKKMGTETSNDK